MKAIVFFSVLSLFSITVQLGEWVQITPQKPGVYFEDLKKDAHERLVKEDATKQYVVVACFSQMVSMNTKYKSISVAWDNTNKSAFLHEYTYLTKTCSSQNFKECTEPQEQTSVKTSFETYLPVHSYKFGKINKAIMKMLGSTDTITDMDVFKMKRALTSTASNTFIVDVEINEGDKRRYVVTEHTDKTFEVYGELTIQ
jgi:hypothetical protein